MPKTQRSEFRLLAGRDVSCELVTPRGRQIFRGTASFEDDEICGPVLSVEVQDKAGDFKLILSESDWRGQIRPGSVLGCDYHLRLSDD